MAGFTEIREILSEEDVRAWRKATEHINWTTMEEMVFACGAEALFKYAFFKGYWMQPEENKDGISDD